MRLDRYINEIKRYSERIVDRDRAEQLLGVPPIQNVDPDELNKIIDFIFINCKPFLREIGVYKVDDNAIFRGIKSPPKSFAIKTGTRQTDRISKYTAQPISDVFDRVFAKKFGWKWRSKGVFTGSKEVAYGYGEPCLFFPIGNYRYVWSDKYSRVWSWLKSEAQFITLSKEDKEKYLKHIVDYAEDAADIYYDKNLKKAIKAYTSFECVFQVKKYIVISDPYYREVVKRL